MEEINLLYVSLNAFAAVMGLLSLLALFMRLLTSVFPADKHAPDATIAAGIASAVEKAIPGARVTRIEPLP
jgi:hypothetical protein